MGKIIRKRLAPSIQSFKGGVRIIGLRGHGRGNDNPPIRGKVKGWSSESRKRMRNYLLTHEPVAGLKSYGTTFTVPGPAIEPEQARRLWNHFAKNFLVRHGMGAVWRLEIQKRGAAHWHCLLAAPPEIKGADIWTVLRCCWTDALKILPPWYVHAGGEDPAPEIIKPGCVRHCVPGLWWDVSRTPCRKPNGNWPESLAYLRDAAQWVQEHQILFGHRVETVMNSDDLKKFSISNWPEGWIYSVHVQEGGGRGAWLRYLQDHATKSKQEQIAEGFGRHWGVVGREKFMELNYEREQGFSCAKSYYLFWRAFHRLTRPVMSYRKRREKSGGKFAGRPFDGRSLGWSSNRGVYGQSVWFSKPETLWRIVEWAESARDSG